MPGNAVRVVVPVDRLDPDDVDLDGVDLEDEAARLRGVDELPDELSESAMASRYSDQPPGGRR